MRALPEKERLLAESLFVVEGKPAWQIAALIGRSKESVHRWVRLGKWVERRRRRLLDSPMASLERLKRERDRLAATLGGDTPLAPEASADTISAVQKLTQTIEKMEPRRGNDDNDAMLATMDRFATFATAHASDEHLAAIRALMEKFFDEERRRSI